MTVGIPHLALPFRLGLNNTGAQVNDQGSVDEVAQNVAVLLSTEIGSRSPLPTYGIEDPAFSQRIDTGPIVAAIATWEPRANVSVAAGGAPVAGVTVNVSVDGLPPQAVVAVQVMPTAPPTPGADILGAGIYDGQYALPPAGIPLLDGGSASQTSGPVLDAGGA